MEESTAIAKVLNVKNYIVETAYAATNGEEMWKGYPHNRYFTATAKRSDGIGVCWLSLENHYYLSREGITER